MRTIIEYIQLCHIHFYQKIARKKVARVNAGYIHCLRIINNRGGVEDTRLEGKAKDTKKSEAKAKDRNARGQGQGPRTQMQVFS